VLAAGAGLYAAATVATVFALMPVWQSNQRLYPALVRDAPG
jgi:hypothetical protein